MDATARRYNPDTDGEAILKILDDLDADDDLSKEIDECDELEVVVSAPRDGQDSDQDDAPSDVEADAARVQDIGKGVLRERIEVRGVKTRGSTRPYRKIISIDCDDISDDENGDETYAPAPRGSEDGNSDDGFEPLKKKKKGEANFSKRKPKQKNNRRIWEEITLDSDKRMPAAKGGKPSFIEDLLDNDASPIDVFREIFDDEILEKMCHETIMYASLKGVQMDCTKNDMLIYLAILLLSGYVKLPQKDCYWEQRPDVRWSFVCNAMSRNRFREIHRFFHLNDNLDIDSSDRLYKVRPLVDHMNEKFLKLILPLGETFSIDEAMEPYYGRHYMKQFIRGKPIRYGFKFWCLTTADGYLVKFEPYVGAAKADLDPRERSAPLGSRVVEKLCENLVPNNSTIFIDNFFTSLPLIQSMSEKNVNVIGTIRADRVQKAPLKDLKREKRGAIHALQERGTNNVLIRWNDNNQVTIASNISDEGVKGITSCKRWSKTEKKEISLPMPVAIKEYNKNMGGVDLFDKMRGLYRMRIRSKKWYWPLVRFMINGAMVNSWLLYRHVDKKMSFLEFTRRVVISILTVPNVGHHRGPSASFPKVSSLVPREVRFDDRGHFVDGIEKQRKCGQCKVNTSFYCTKCNVALHPKKCFVAYHQP